jgi:hypothetical protein
MAYDPTREGLAEEDARFLDAVHDKFLEARLAKVAPNSVMGHLIGKILEESERRGISWRGLVVSRLPVTVEAARAAHGLSPADERAIEYSRQQSARYITDMAERMKAAVREQITRAVAAREPPRQLAQTLFQQFSEANRDWRRIALTEAACAVANGYLSAIGPEEWVVGSSSVNCCDWCREHIQARAFRVLPEAPGEPTEEQSSSFVWVAKTNIGRSRYSLRLDGTKREPAELWHPCIPAHPHCRCRWRRLIPSVEAIQAGTNLVVQKQDLGI